jgi:hypothetical protein
MSWLTDTPGSLIRVLHKRLLLKHYLQTDDTTFRLLSYLLLPLRINFGILNQRTKKGSSLREAIMGATGFDVLFFFF